jgi:hypothetical protein
MNHFSMKQTLLVLSLFLTHVSAHAQQAAVAAGGMCTGTGSVSYSVGQVVYTPNSTNAITVTQGVQQTYGIPVIAGMDETIAGQVTVYPNPSAEWLTLELTSGYEQASFRLSDENGKIVLAEKTDGPTTIIPVGQLPAGTYFLEILGQTFQIIKTNQP